MKPTSARKRLYPFNERRDSTIATSAHQTSAERRIKHTARYATIGAAFGHILHRTESAFVKVLGEAVSPRNRTRRAESAPPTDENNPPVRNSGSLRRTISSGSVDTFRVSGVRSIKRRPEQKGAGERIKQERARVARHHSGVGAPSGSVADIGPVKTTPKKKKTSHESEPMTSRMAPGNIVEGEESRQTADTVATATQVLVAPCEPSVDINSTAPIDGRNVDSDITSPHQRLALRDVGLECPPPPMLRNLSPGLDDSSEESDFEYFMNKPKKTFYIAGDLSLIICTPQSDITIWDGRRGEYYSFPSQLFIRCLNQEKFNVWRAPKVNCIDLTCGTIPITGRYKAKRTSQLYTSYMGARLENAYNEPAIVRARDGVHIDKNWEPAQDKDGVWGWCANVWTPIPMTLFDRAETKVFIMKGEVSVRSRTEEITMRAELNFSVSVLLREEYMA
ncbi:hypothetical protein EDD16DRAFT_812374 [Pisolithus croceorrhizus]|nr:hypothetical protein EDD16DRAFT_812374 [Pisolithus croceorrhizus]KAI6152749.1 hypothetical protein EDD17DRAFT_1125240 [Pisolithus thermaeus]